MKKNNDLRNNGLEKQESDERNWKVVKYVSHNIKNETDD